MRIKIVHGLVFIFLVISAPVLAVEQLRVWCIEPTPKPKCCQAVSDSAGSQVQYYWWASRGEMDPQVTPVNYSDYHCRTVQSFRVDLEVNAGPGILYGSGRFNC